MEFLIFKFLRESWKKGKYPEPSVAKLSLENMILRIFIQKKNPSMDEKFLSMDKIAICQNPQYIDGNISSMADSVIHRKNDG